MTAILVFFCFHANWLLWPRPRLNIFLNFTFESKAIRANLHGNKRILKCHFGIRCIKELKDNVRAMVVSHAKHYCESCEPWLRVTRVNMVSHASHTV